MYPSDEYMVYGFGVNSDCYNDPQMCFPNSARTGWIYNSNNLEGETDISDTWFISLELSSSRFVLFLDSGGVLYNNNAYIKYAVRPVLYLSSNVKIIDGTGEQSNPYKLGL